MSFTFGPFDSDSVGAIATLREFPSIDGLQLETLEAVGTDGQILGGTTRSSARYVFDTIVSGATPEEAAARRDALALAVDPRRGEKALTFDAAPGWQWQAILSSSIRWSRMTWDTGVGFKFRADVAFDALGAYGRLVNDETWPYATPGNRVVTRAEGNAGSYPAVEVEGTLTDEETVTVEVGGVEVTVTGPLNPGEVLRLDWDAFDFGRWNGATKIASVVRSMSTLDRPELWPSEPSPFNTATTGSLTRTELFANSRRQ